MFRNLHKYIAGAMLLCALTGCAAVGGETAALLHQEAEEAALNLTQVQIGDVQKIAPGLVSCEAFYARDEMLSCAPVAGMILEECFAANGDTVEKGQVLARFRLPEDETAHAELTNALAEAELRFEAARARAEGAVAAARSVLDSTGADTPAGEAAALRLEKANYTLEHLDLSEVTAARQALKNYEEALEGRELTAPFAGTVEQVLRVKEDAVKADTAFCRLYTQDDVFLLAPSVNEAAYRVGAQVTVLLKNEPYCGAVICSSAEAYDVVNKDVVLRPDAGTDCTVFFEQNAGLTLKAERLFVKQVLRLPRNAVRNENGRYYVYQYDGGMLHKRYVQLGLEGADPQTGEAYVQIVEGLSENDQVSLG